jgi:hypothetical protein
VERLADGETPLIHLAALTRRPHLFIIYVRDIGCPAAEKPAASMRHPAAPHDVSSGLSSESSMKKIILGTAAIACLTLVACGSGVPSKKNVNVKPVDPAKTVAPAGSSFKGSGSSLGNTDKVDPSGKPKEGGS